ncbi:hypothetical protein Dimus_031384 [Dionaea muscipula]
MIVTHLKKKDVVKSKVRGVDLEFDHEKSATILGVPGKNGICEYIKEVWEESKYTKPLEITVRFANDDTIMKAVRVKSVEMKPSQRFIHFLAEGESGSDDQFYDAQLEVEEPVTETPAASAVPASSPAQQKEQGTAGVDPSGHTSREAEFLKFQAEFERKRANRFHDDLEKAKAENARLLALLHQAQTKPHP